MRPIFIMGPPRSGTRMLARCLGRSENTCLITEHKNKARDIPEEDNPLSDHVYWERSGGDLSRLRAIWERQAQGRRLIIKNPQNVTRADRIREAFPEARFVWLIRDPWAAMRSMILSKREGGMFLSTAYELPDDRTLRAAATWAEGVRAMLRHPDLTVRYEDITRDPQGPLGRLYADLALTPKDHATAVPRYSEPDYSVARYLLRKSPYRREALRLVAPLAAELDYPERPPGAPGSGHVYEVRAFWTWLKEPKKKPPYGFPLLEKLRVKRGAAWIDAKLRKRRKALRKRRNDEIERARKLI